MKNNTVYPPLALLKQISAAYPNAWRNMEMFHVDNGENGLPAWPEWCYAPIAAAISVATGNLPDSFEVRMNSMRDAQRIAAMAPWRVSKEVYVMDEGMQELLFEQADDLKLDPEAVTPRKECVN